MTNVFYLTKHQHNRKYYHSYEKLSKTITKKSIFSEDVKFVAKAMCLAVSKMIRFDQESKASIRQRFSS